MRAEDLFAELEQTDPEFRAAWAFEGPKMELGLNVYHLRLERNWTQADLASRAGMRQPRIAEIERGDGNPKFETLIRLASAFDVAVSTLVSGSPPEHEPVDGSLDWGWAAHTDAIHEHILSGYTPQFGSTLHLVAKSRNRPVPPSRAVFSRVGVLETLERIQFDAKGNRSLFDDDEGWTHGFTRQHDKH